MFGGNSKWRGPAWIPLNYLLIETLHQLYAFYGDNTQLACPTGSTNICNLSQIAKILSEKIISIFHPDVKGERTVHIIENWFYNQPENKELVLFYEYYNGDTAKGMRHHIKQDGVV